MRELTFKGFLKQYVKSLSYSGTNGLYKLAAEAASGNPRLREPLLLYALFSGKETVLMQATKDMGLQIEYSGLLRQYDIERMKRALCENDSLLPERYRRVYRSYMSIVNKRNNDKQVKLLMRNRIIKLQQEKKISTYRIYTDLKLNHGNINTYIKNGNCTKISLDTARSVLAYLES